MDGFQEVPKNNIKVEGLVGPVLKVDRDHQYGIIQEKAPETSALTGPIYILEENGHHYNIAEGKVQPPKTLQGPIYQMEEANHHFNIIQEHVQGLKNLSTVLSQLDSFNKRYTCTICYKIFYQAIHLVSLLLLISFVLKCSLFRSK